MAFLGVFLAALRCRIPPRPRPPATLRWPRARAAGDAGFAYWGWRVCGALFLAEHRRLKRRQARPGSGLPSLESLDRAGAVALAVGFPLLTLGVVTGAMWVHAAHGAALTGSPHEIGALLAWCVYLALVLQRFAAHQRAAAPFCAGGLALLGVGGRRGDARAKLLPSA
jgi:ABC-type transport system involved in cytochrome c biogenesis permease subunit